MYRDLDRVVQFFAEFNVSTEAVLLQYSQQFLPVTVLLVKMNRLTSRERDRWFWQGLPSPVRHAIARRLELQDPTNYSRNDPPDFDKAVSAGRFVLSDYALDGDYDEPIVPRSNLFKRTPVSLPRQQPPARMSRYLPYDGDEDEFAIIRKTCPRTGRFSSSNACARCHRC